MNDAEMLTLIVPELDGAPDGGGKEEDFQEEAVPAFITRIFHRPKEVDPAKLREGLGRLEGQVAELLTGINKGNVGGFRLNSVEVAVALSAEGSIGVATAGVEASMALTFERVDGDAAKAD